MAATGSVRFGLRDRLGLPVILLLALDVAVTIWAAVAAAQRSDEQLNERLATVFRTLAEPPTFPLTPAVLEKMRNLTGAELLLVRSGKIERSTFSSIPQQEIVDVQNRVLNGVPYRSVEFPLPPTHPESGATLVLCDPISLRQQAQWRAVLPPLILGVAVALAGLVSFALARRVVARIQQVQRAATGLVSGLPEPLPVPPQRDELRELFLAFNEAAGRLKAYERERLLTERLRVLGQLRAGLIHQLRNTAGGARLAVQVFCEDHVDLDTEALGVALGQLDRLEGSLRQFLLVGTVDDTTREPIDLAGLLDGLVALHRPQCRHTGIELDWIKPATIRVDGDGDGLGHLFGNLLGNAIEAAGPGGRVAIEVDEIGPVVRVVDTGPGPAPDVAARLFEPFATDKRDGIGLGLTVAKQAAEANGAALNWYRRGESTVFEVTFSREGPVRSIAAEPSPRRPESDPASSPSTPSAPSA